jgi:hypothetical protein
VSQAPTVVQGPGWVDHTTIPISGLFPLSVERYLNSAVAHHAPGVTTVTSAARYYALHAMVAHEKQKTGLSDQDARALLRRVEVVYATVCRAHKQTTEHPDDWNVDAHGNDFLRDRLAAGPVKLSEVADIGSGTYAKASWGFWGPYRGSEMMLTVLDTKGFLPGPGYDDSAVRGALGPVLELAQKATTIGLSDVAGLGAACLCQTSHGTDGAWLAHLFAGDADAGGTVGILGQTMRMLATAMTTTTLTSERDLAQFVMYDPTLLQHDRLAIHEVCRRWRGIVMRAESVNAWRFLWGDLCAQLPTQGATPQGELRDWLADLAPTGTVQQFADSLPPTVGDYGEPLPAELDQVLGNPQDPMRRIAVILLGARRQQELKDSELLGFRGRPNRPEAVEELSPHWVNSVFQSWGPRPMRDFNAHLVDVMLNRSQRIALRKSRYDRKTGNFTIPSRVNVRDGLVFRLFGEVPRQPSLRWTQLLSMGRQVGLFDRNPDGRWVLGKRGNLVA